MLEAGGILSQRLLSCEREHTLPKDPTRRHWLLRATPTDIPLLVIAFMMIVSVAISPLPERSLSAIWPLALGVVLYWVICHWPWREGQLVWLWRGVVGLGLVVTVLGLAGMVAKPQVLIPQLQTVMSRVQARLAFLSKMLPDTFHPNVIAGIIVLTLPFALTRALATRLTRDTRALAETFACGEVSVLMLAVLLLTQSRAGFLGLAASAVVMLALLRPRWLLIVIPLGLVAMAAVGSLVGWVDLVDTLVSSDPAYGWGWRKEVWRSAAAMLSDFGFTGVGFGCFQQVMDLLYPMPSGSTAPHAHDLLLQVGIDLGGIGLTAFVVLVGRLLYQTAVAYRDAQRVGNPDNVLLAASYLAAVVGMLVHGILDAAVWGNKGAFIMWVVLATGQALTTDARLRKGRRQ